MQILIFTSQNQHILGNCITLLNKHQSHIRYPCVASKVRVYTAYPPGADIWF